MNKANASESKTDYSVQTSSNYTNNNKLQEDQMTSSTAIEQPVDFEVPRRQPNERREFSVRTIYNSLTKPRRRDTRREQDAVNPILDFYGWTEMLSAMALVLFSITDATFTLLLILKGGEELNPVMDYFLQMGVFEFVAIKLLMTSLCAFSFVACWNYLAFSFFRVRYFLFVSIAMYSVLIAYELKLLNVAYPNFFG